jgi:hypothetical protein
MSHSPFDERVQPTHSPNRFRWIRWGTRTGWFDRPKSQRAETLINLPQTKKIGNDVIRRHQLTGSNRKSLHPSIRGGEMRPAESWPRGQWKWMENVPFWRSQCHRRRVNETPTNGAILRGWRRLNLFEPAHVEQICIGRPSAGRFILAKLNQNAVE